MLPTVAVEGVGAVEDPVPPVAAVYHKRFVPVAVNGVAVAPWQYTTGVVTPGAEGTDVTTKIAEVEVAAPFVFVTITRYW